jgi:hypothetical protein
MLLGFSHPARAADDNAWQLKAQDKGVSVFSRPRSGSDILELKATGTIDAPPPAVFKVLSDYAGYKKIMPYKRLVRQAGRGGQNHENPAPKTA